MRTSAAGGLVAWTRWDLMPGEPKCGTILGKHVFGKEDVLAHLHESHNDALFYFMAAQELSPLGLAQSIVFEM